MAQVGISQNWLNNLTRYANGLQQQAQFEAEQNMRQLHEAAVARARETPGWERLADHIEVWSQDGKLHVGIRKQEFISEAWAMEYGDEQHAPSPLFRTLTDQVSLINENARTAAIARYGSRIT